MFARFRAAFLAALLFLALGPVAHAAGLTVSPALPTAGQAFTSTAPLSLTYEPIGEIAPANTGYQIAMSQPSGSWENQSPYSGAPAIVSAQVYYAGAWHSAYPSIDPFYGSWPNVSLDFSSVPFATYGVKVNFSGTAVTTGASYYPGNVGGRNGTYLLAASDYLYDNGTASYDIPSGNPSATVGIQVAPGPFAKFGPALMSWPGYFELGQPGYGFETLSQDVYGNSTNNFLPAVSCSASSGICSASVLTSTQGPAGFGWWVSYYNSSRLGPTTVSLAGGGQTQTVSGAVYPDLFFSGPNSIPDGGTVDYSVYLGPAMSQQTTSGGYDYTGQSYAAPSGGYTLSLTSGSGLSVPSTLTIPPGQAYAMFPVTATASGNDTLQVAIAVPGGSITQSVGVTVSPPPTQLSLASPGGQEGSYIPVAITLENSSGQPADAPSPETVSLSTTAGAIYDTPGGSQISSTVVPQGQDSATVYLYSSASGIVQVDASVSGLTGAVVNITVAGPPVQAGLSTSNGQAGQYIPLVLTLQDANYYAAEAPSDWAFSLSSTGGTLYATKSGGTPISSVVVPQGQSSATVYFMSDQAGSYNVQATGPVPVHTYPFTVTSGPATSLGATLTPTDGGGFDGYQVGIAAEDAYSNPAAGPLTLDFAGPSGGTFSQWPGGTTITSETASYFPATVYFAPASTVTQTLTISVTGLNPVTLTIPGNASSPGLLPIQGPQMAGGMVGITVYAASSGQPGLPISTLTIPISVTSDTGTPVGLLTDPTGSVPISSTTLTVGQAAYSPQLILPGLYSGPVIVSVGSNSQTVQVTNPMPLSPVTVALNAGWNQVAVPFALDSSSTLQTMIADPSLVTAASVYGSNGWSQISGGYVPPEATAMAVYATASTSITFTPAAVQPNPVLTLSPGWNLVGAPGPYSEPPAEFTDRVSAIQALTGGGLSVSDPQSDMTDTLAPGQGYWVYVSGSSPITISGE